MHFYFKIILEVCSHLNASLGQVYTNSQPLSHANIWVLRLLEGFLQSLQLRHCECSAAAALLLLVAIASLEDELWQEENGSSTSLQARFQQLTEDQQKCQQYQKDNNSHLNQE